MSPVRVRSPAPRKAHNDAENGLSREGPFSVWMEMWPFCGQALTFTPTVAPSAGRECRFTAMQVEVDCRCDRSGLEQETAHLQPCGFRSHSPFGGCLTLSGARLHGCISLARTQGVVEIDRAGVEAACAQWWSAKYSFGGVRLRLGASYGLPVGHSTWPSPSASTTWPARCGPGATRRVDRRRQP
jgi:hypothetical protein